MKRKKTLINSHRELVAIKSKLGEQISKKEKDFLRDYDVLSRFVELSGVYKHKKHKNAKQDIHALVVKLVSDFIGESHIFGKERQRMNDLLLPALTMGLSVFIVNAFSRKSKNKGSTKPQE